MLEDIKLRVMNVAKQAQREGMCKHRSGNFSMLDRKTGLIVMTPSGVDRERLVVPDMVVMDLDANVVENQTGLRPTSECLMHIRIYQTRPDVVAVAHTHSQFATTFAILNRPIPAVVYELFNLKCTKGRVPVAPYARPGTTALAECVVEPVREADAFLLRSHGSVAVDEGSVEEAYLKNCYIEEIAELYYHALTVNGGKEPDVLPPEELQKWAYPTEIKFPNAR